jgi:predicted phosphodiesterase
VSSDLGRLTVAELRKLLAIHKTKSRVAEKLSVSKNRISRLCKKWGILDDKDMIEQVAMMLDSALGVIKPYQVMPRDKDLAPERFVVHFTDWHAGKKVVRENDIVTYDVDIFKERVDLILEKILYLLDRHIKIGSPIGQIEILNTGDMCNGENIYEGQEYQQVLAPPNQVMLVVEAQMKFIKALLKAGYPVLVHCVKGNHGRVAHSDPTTNWDVMVYKILDFWQKVEKVENLIINYTESEYINVDINGWKYHLRHIAYEQGDTSAGRSKFHGWKEMHDADAIVYGHWHHWGCFPVDKTRVFRGGSLVGPDEFSDKLGKCSKPIQLVWGVPKGRVSSFMYPVDLGEE